MTQFGYASDSNSPPAQRMEAKASGIARLRADIVAAKGEAVKLKKRIWALKAKLAVERAKLAEFEALGALPATPVHIIQSVVTEFFGLALADMTSRRQGRAVVLGRRTAMCIARSLTKHSQGEIARLFDVDHTTICLAMRRIKTRLLDPTYAAQYVEVEALCLKAFAERVAP